MHSQYLDLPCRSEAEVTLEKCKLIRAAVENFQTNIRKRIQEVGGQPEWIDLSDMLSDAIHDVEQGAQYLVDTANGDLEREHERQERGFLIAGSGVKFGRVA